MYPYLGNTQRSYPQYWDLGAVRMLVADPGGVYDIEPVQGAGPVTVPPNDGLWGDPIQPPAPEKTTKKAAPAAEEVG